MNEPESAPATAPSPDTVGARLRLRTIDAMNQGAARAAADESPIVVLSNGIMLQAKPVARGLLQRIQEQIPEPSVPTVELPEHGRSEPNPMDPDYLDALELCYRERLAADNNARMAFGWMVNSVPDGFFRPEEDGWIEELRFAGIAATSEGPGRMLDWLNLYALATPVDEAVISAKSYMTTAITEGEVVRAMAYFRRRALGGTAPQPATQETALHGDRVPSPVPGGDA